jgi:exoribonuclease-2
VRPAISILAEVKANAEVLQYEVVASLIKVRHQLSYYDVNTVAGEDPRIKALWSLAKNFRSWRLANKAIQINLPEIHIWLDEHRQIGVTRVNRESPGRMLVAELMIMANWLMARFLSDHQCPAVFRSQPGPRERLFEGENGTLFQNWMQRRHLSRFVLAPQAEPHTGLGLEAYITATSPIRKYYDLVTQRQIRAVLGLEDPYSLEEIDQIMQRLEIPMANVFRTQSQRSRYWLLKYLEGHVGGKEPALVLGRRRNSYQVLLTEYMLECELPLSGGMEFKPEDVLEVTLQRVDARRGVLSIFIS